MVKLFIYIQITYVDKKNKIKKTIFVDKNRPIDEFSENKNILEEFNIKENIKFSKSLKYSDESCTEKNEENKYGLKDSYPIEQFFDFYSAQRNRKITLHTYKYPAKKNIKGLVYHM